MNGAVCKGESALSRLLDAFVCVHCATAFLFASLMLFYPDAFGWFLKGGEDALPDVAKDAIKWCVGFRP